MGWGNNLYLVLGGDYIVQIKNSHWTKKKKENNLGDSIWDSNNIN